MDLENEGKRFEKTESAYIRFTTKRAVVATPSSYAPGRQSLSIRGTYVEKKN